MALPLYWVDAFSGEAFRGNPAAVCVLPEARPDAWMQDLAAELNLSETAFVRDRPDGWHLRWFTPRCEVALCGHATLATAHVLWQTGRLPPTAPACFLTRGGTLTAERRGEWIEMDFPADPPHPIPHPPDLERWLGQTPAMVAKGREDLLVVLHDAAAVRACQPDLAVLARLPVRGLIVTAESDVGEADFVSRFFAPACGIAEDPVTGSAHCTLAVFWSGFLKRDAMVGRQLSARGGDVRVSLQGDRVLLSGRAVTVATGQWLPA